MHVYVLRTKLVFGSNPCRGPACLASCGLCKPRLTMHHQPAPSRTACRQRRFIPANLSGLQLRRLLRCGRCCGCRRSPGPQRHNPPAAAAATCTRQGRRHMPAPRARPACAGGLGALTVVRLLRRLALDWAGRGACLPACLPACQRRSAPHHTELCDAYICWSSGCAMQRAVRAHACRLPPGLCERHLPRTGPHVSAAAPPSLQRTLLEHLRRLGGTQQAGQLVGSRVQVGGWAGPPHLRRMCMASPPP